MMSSLLHTYGTTCCRLYVVGCVLLAPTIEPRSRAVGVAEATQRNLSLSPRPRVTALLDRELQTPQGKTIRGVVVDSGGKPVPFAVVMQIASGRSVEADENGRFRLPLEQLESCSLGVRRAGFHGTALNLSTCPDTALRIVLRRAPRDEPGPRCGTRSTPACEAPNAPTLERISAGYAHSCGLERNATAWCWGDGRKGALGDGANTMQRWPRRVAGEYRFAQIVAGANFTCGLTRDGSLLCWGTSEVVPGWPRPAVKPQPIGGFDASARLTAGSRHACVLRPDGQALCWGWNVDGETGTGSSGITSSLVATPTPVVDDHRFSSLSAGFNFTCGVTVTGQVLCWGNNVDGVLGEQAGERCGDVDPVPCSARPVEIKTPEPMRQVSSGTTHACALAESGSVYCWGGNAHGQFGGVSSTSRTPQRVPLPSAEKVVTIASGGVETCGVTMNEVLYCWGADYRSTRVGGLSNKDVAPRRVAAGVTTVAAGQLHFCALTRGGSIRCWGDTIMGAFGSR